MSSIGFLRRFLVWLLRPVVPVIMAEYYAAALGDPETRKREADERFEDWKASFKNPPNRRHRRETPHRVPETR